MSRSAYYGRHMARPQEARAIRNEEPADFTAGINKHWAKARESVYRGDSHFEEARVYLGETITSIWTRTVDEELCRRLLERNPYLRTVFGIEKNRGEELSYSDLGYFGAHLKCWVIKHKQEIARFTENPDIWTDVRQEQS